MSREVNLLHDVDSVALSQLLPGLNPAAPSPDSIASLYKLVLSQASDLAATQRELDAATSLSDKREVELDQALQDRERLSQELDSKVDSFQQQLTKLQHEKEQLSRSRFNLYTAPILCSYLPIESPGRHCAHILFKYLFFFTAHRIPTPLGRHRTRKERSCRSHLPAQAGRHAARRHVISVIFIPLTRLS